MGVAPPIHVSFEPDLQGSENLDVAAYFLGPKFQNMAILVDLDQRRRHKFAKGIAVRQVVSSAQPTTRQKGVLYLIVKWLAITWP
jgi:hypothetical protein